MFICKTCKSSLPTLASYNKHQKSHRNLKKIEINCQYSNCHAKLTSYDSFRKHINRKHKCADEGGKYFCKLKDCNFKTHEFSSINKHVKSHLKETNDGIPCPFSRCPRKSVLFYNENNYTAHVVRNHFDEETNVSISNNDNSESDDNYSQSNEQYTANVSSTTLGLNEDPILLKAPNFAPLFNSEPFTILDDVSKLLPTINQEETQMSDVSKKSMDLCLNLSTKYNATEPLIQEVISKSNDIFELCKNNFLSSLSNSDLSEVVKTTVTTNFNNSFNDLNNAFGKQSGFLRNSHNRNKFYSYHLNLVLPEEVDLLNDNGEITGYSYTYVPIKETLKSMLAVPSIRAYCENVNIPNNDRLLFDIGDGKLMKSNALLENHSDVVELMLFQDAFEVCNPLGSSKKKFKIVAMYMVLLNLPPHLRTKMENIQLVFLCLESNISKFGWDKILQRLIDDLKELETVGINLLVNEIVKVFFGTLIVMLGDNLGSHQIGGYCTNFSTSHFFCRYCEISRDEFYANIFCKRTLRTVDSYTKDAKDAIKNKTNVKGILSDSPLNKLKYYHVAGPGLPPCIAHDCHEGFVKKDLFAIIGYFISEGWFSLDFLNFKLNDFKFPFESSTFVPEIKIKGNDKKKLDGTASQIRRIILLFPVVVAQKIEDFENPVWKMYLLLRSICLTVCAPALSRGQIALLQIDIDNYFRAREECFPSLKLTPKHEYLRHYPWLITQFGPLKHLWTLRFENKHSTLKNDIRHFTNFKNVTQTLAKKHQLKQSHFPASGTSTVETHNEIPFIPEAHECFIVDMVNNIFNGNVNEDKYETDKLTFHGIEYAKNMSVCVGKNKFGNFLLCKIDFMIINTDYTDLAFFGKTEEIVFNSKVGVYEIGEVDNIINSFPYAFLLSPDPIPQTKIADVPVFVPKYAPLDPDY